MKSSGLITPTQVRVAIAVFVIPIVLHVLTLSWLMLMPDRTIAAILTALDLNWFSWSSIRKIVERPTYDRMRLCVAVSLVFGTVSLLFYCTMLFVFGDTEARAKIPIKETVSSLIFAAITGAVVFVLPNAYVSTRVGISPDIAGVFYLTVLTFGISFCGILPLMKLLNLFTRTLKIGGS